MPTRARKRKLFVCQTERLQEPLLAGEAEKDLGTSEAPVEFVKE